METPREWMGNTLVSIITFRNKDVKSCTSYGIKLMRAINETLGKNN